MKNIIYKLINRRKEQIKEYPCYYVGSKTNYVPGTYWGSSQNPILIEDLEAFRDTCFDRYFESTNEYFEQDQKLKKSRSVEKILEQ